MTLIVGFVLTFLSAGLCLFFFYLAGYWSNKNRVVFSAYLWAQAMLSCALTVYLFMRYIGTL